MKEIIPDKRIKATYNTIINYKRYKDYKINRFLFTHHLFDCSIKEYIYDNFSSKKKLKGKIPFSYFFPF